MVSASPMMTVAAGSLDASPRLPISVRGIAISITEAMTPMNAVDAVNVGGSPGSLESEEHGVNFGHGQFVGWPKEDPELTMIQEIPAMPLESIQTIFSELARKFTHPTTMGAEDTQTPTVRPMANAGDGGLGPSEGPDKPFDDFVRMVVKRRTPEMAPPPKTAAQDPGDLLKPHSRDGAQQGEDPGHPRVKSRQSLT